jgi:hypothetical protein
MPLHEVATELPGNMYLKHLSRGSGRAVGNFDEKAEQVKTHFGRFSKDS